MINSDLNAELRAKYNPDGSKLRLLQLKELEILKVVNDICRRNKIPYWLSSGTLLGAIRHGGFIPWDDDIDIEILYKDRKKFIRACKKELPQNLCIQYHGTDQEYFLNILKIRDKTEDIGEKITFDGKNSYDVLYKAKGCFVDVFCEERAFPSMLRIMSVLHIVLLKKRRVNHWNLLVCNIFYVILQIVNCILRFLGVFFANRKYIYHSYGSCFTSRRDINHIKPLVDISFEGVLLSSPSNYEGYLREMFGNYMELPAEKLRDTRHSS